MGLLHTLFQIEQLYFAIAITLLWGAHLRKNKREKHLKHEVGEIESRLQRDENRISNLERKKKHGVEHYKIHQLGGSMANSITGVVAGAVGKFQGLAVPAGSVVTGTPTWASDNALAVVTVDPSDSTGSTVSVAVDSTATGSFNLSLSSTNPDGTVATGTASVPVLPAPPPPPVAVQNFDINQLS